MCVLSSASVLHTSHSSAVSKKKEKKSATQIQVTLAPRWFSCFVAILSSRVFLSHGALLFTFHFSILPLTRSDLLLSKKF